MFYKIIEQKNPLKKDEKMYVPRSISRGRIEFKDLAKDLAQGSALDRGEISAVLMKLRDRMHFYLREGFIISLDEIGTLSTHIRGKAAKKLEDFSAEKNIKKVCVRFTPTANLRKQVETIGVQFLNSGASKHSVDKLPVAVSDEDSGKSGGKKKNKPESSSEGDL